MQFELNPLDQKAPLENLHAQNQSLEAGLEHSVDPSDNHKNHGTLVQSDSGSKNNNSAHNYRPQVDGLRAVAIISVLIYHAFPHAIPGGFIGVDVFFVISGFLITGIIAKQIQAQKFSFIDFYCRRIKRIYPVLILTLCFALYVISNVMEDDLRGFSLDTLDTSLIFGTNIQILLHKKGYFDRDIRDNCLLHLWSLGVQEQFYIFWPFLLIFISRYFKKFTFHILVFCALFSFGYSIAMVYISPKFAFYFPFCRFWQMACGGILAYLNFQIRNKIINNLLSTVGLGIIVIGCYVMNDESLFPGFWALIPTIGAMMIIQARQESFINSQILSSWICVWIGKISYSLYLWHWPLLVFSWVFYPKGSESIFSNTYFIIALTFAASILSYFTVEDRIRKIKGWKIAIWLLLLMGVVGLISIPLRFSLSSQRKAVLDNPDYTFRPTEDDYVTVNGVRQPNFSYNKYRFEPDNVVKLNVAKIDQDRDIQKGGQPFLQKNVDSSSKYSQVPMPWQMTHFKVANQGSKNQLFIIGDSHAKKTTFRFQQLYEQSILANRKQSFPTVVAVIRQAFELAESNILLNFTRQLVKTHKPNKIFFVCNWLCYLCRNLTDEISNLTTNCSMEKVYQEIPQFVNFLKEIRDQGVEVFTNKIDINNIQLDPSHMFDMRGVIPKNVQPFKYSDFRNKFKAVVNYYEESLGNANITMIDFADNLCWQDVCHVVSPKGYGLFVDRDHYGKHYAKYWLSVVDQLVVFDQDQMIHK